MQLSFFSLLLITLVSNTFSSIFSTMTLSFCIFLFLIIISSSGSLPDEESLHNRKIRELIIPSRRGKLLENGKTALHDSIKPSTEVFSTTTPSSTMPPDSATPTIVTVPVAFPGTVTVTPTGPAFSNAPPITITPTIGPLNQPPPITYPVTTPTGPIVTIPGVQPITNPVTTYPAPGNIPTTTPVVAPPALTNPPAILGQSWCVARNEATETALQAALDYACGAGGSDCSLIQQGGSCYNPNTLQNHASFAFNSYYQKNPQTTSCDFGGTASIVNTNPSTGSCIYPSSSSSSSPLSSSPPSTLLPTSPPSTLFPTSPPSTLFPIPPSILTPVTPASPLGTYSTPTVLNSSYPTSGSTTVAGSPFGNNPSSMAAESLPYIGSIIMITTLMTVKNLMCLLN